MRQDALEYLDKNIFNKSDWLDSKMEMVAELMENYHQYMLNETEMKVVEPIELKVMAKEEIERYAKQRVIDELDSLVQDYREGLINGYFNYIEKRIEELKED